MINCIAIDDEPLALDLLVKYSSQLDFIDLKKTFTQTSEALAYMKKFPIDLIFLDIQMPDISGIDFYKSLKDSKMVIFTTAYSEYAVEGFNLNAVDYLLKPIKFSRFEQAVRKSKDYLDYLSSKDLDSQPFLYVRSDYRLIRIPLSDILYIEGLDDYVKIFCGQRKPILSRISLKAIAERLPAHRFLRVHRSFIIPTTRELSLCNKHIQIGDIQVPIGVSYEDEVMKLFGK